MRFFAKNNPYKGKRILIYGLGRSGLSAKAFLSSCGAKVQTFVDGEKNKKINFEKLSMAVVSPGVNLDSKLVCQLKRAGVPILAELELGYLNVNGNYIAITGTNGKTTTVSLVYKILEGQNTFLAGNIGIPLTSLAGKTDSRSIIVCEVSSYQLETCKQFRPKISAILNLAPDHLARHKTCQNYFNCKAKIFQNQTENDYCVLNYDEEEVMALSEKCVAKKYYFSKFNQLSNPNFKGAYLCGEEIYFKENFYNVYIMNKAQIKLVGEKNLENVLAAITIASLCGLSGEKISSKVSNFFPLPNRLEFVLKKGNITCINDSKATNIASALSDISATSGNIVVLLGGSDKGEDFKRLFSNLNESVKHAIIYGASSEKMVSSAGEVGFKNFSVAKNLKEAVSQGIKFCREFDGEINLLLSPACASFDEFKNFEQRGNYFKKLVMEELK